MKTRTGTLIQLVVFAIFVLVASDFARRFQQAREAGRRSAYKVQLDLAWKVVVQYQDADKLIPPAVTTFEDSEGKNFQQSWRIIAYSDVTRYGNEMEWVEKYRTDEPWDSPNNLSVAEAVVADGYNYFGATFGDVHDASPSDAGILVVTGPGGAWLKDGLQSKKELMAKEDKIAMVYLTDSNIKLFEPQDITFQELIQLVREKGRIHAYTAQGKFRILDAEWAEKTSRNP